MGSITKMIYKPKARRVTRSSSTLFLSFERSAHSKGIFPEVQDVMKEYFDQNHAEEVPQSDLEKPIPIHVVCKE